MGERSISTLDLSDVGSLIRSISDGGVGDRVASFVYSLATQVLCAKDVPRADTVSNTPQF